MDSYLNAYVDRRMKYIVEGWDLSAGADFFDFTERLYALEQEIPWRQVFEQAAVDNLTELETCARKWKRMS